MGGAAAEHGPVTVQQLAAAPPLRGAELVGGIDGQGNQVTSVRLAPSTRDGGDDFAGAVVLMDGEQLARDTYLVDFTLRWMHDLQGGALVVVSARNAISLASCRLADKLGVPLLTVDGDLLQLADGLREIVHAPDRVMSALVIDGVHRLSRVSPAQGLPGLLEALGETLGADATLIGAEGSLVAGAPLATPVEDRDRLPVPMGRHHHDRYRLVHPITLASGEAPSFWLVVETAAPTTVWTGAAGMLAHVASQHVAMRLVSHRLELERDARFRLGVLNAVMASSDHPEPALVQQLATLGWATEGWCSAVHIRVGASESARVLALTDELFQELDRLDLTGPVIERPDGWTTWLTTPTEPTAAVQTATVQRLRGALREFGNGHATLRLHAGIGRPYPGVAGLKRSLDEARQAATLVAAGGTRVGLQHIDEFGVQRILFGWYTSDDFGEFARTLLHPVQSIDRDEDLIRTLEVFLDNESSPTVTAAILGVHRNTVIKRVARIRSAMSVDLDEPDQRLAVQLACRVVNLRH
ncbi:CdaR family transcriptional regulator [Pimelobacter sp. 30-1]|uniref:PucR family transcriptional regulator n=1 Tax=Pimelobacter sp. 30-1 TaxID=2004991 RepID=UPI001C0415B8|nr:helix-turn-helix domain-containing protein [Pimelobacter sp. 30-1]MBU2694467.1 hypothetical protein [Pimelobacter sp. 30-1]